MKNIKDNDVEKLVLI